MRELISTSKKKKNQENVISQVVLVLQDCNLHTTPHLSQGRIKKLNICQTIDPTAAQTADKRKWWKTNGRPFDGGGFFLACEEFDRMFDNSFPACASFSSLFF